MPHLLQEALTQAFVLHYSRISMMLEQSTDPDTLSNRVVHVSVQLFSNEALALRMVDKLNLLHVMVTSLKYMMTKILIPNTLHGQSLYFNTNKNSSDSVIPVLDRLCGVLITKNSKMFKFVSSKLHYMALVPPPYLLILSHRTDKKLERVSRSLTDTHQLSMLMKVLYLISYLQNSYCG